MRTTLHPGAMLLAAAIVHGPAAQQPDPSQGEALVRIETALGTIDLAIDVTRAPISAANFLKYVDGGFYDGGLIADRRRLSIGGRRLADRRLTVRD